jgi:hypothetical protein
MIGVAYGNPMKLATSVGLYAAVGKEVFSNSELPFPGSKETFLGHNCWTRSKLLAEFCVWAATADGVGGEGFNFVNGDTESWHNKWPKLFERFGGKIPANHFQGQYGDFEGSETHVAPKPPIEDCFSKIIGMEGEFPPNYIKPRIDGMKWSQREDVKKACEKFQKQYDGQRGVGESGMGLHGFHDGKEIITVL